MRFLVDMPLSPELAAWLRMEGHDAAHASDLGLSRATDANILALAKQQGRTIVTADLDYPRLLALAEANDPSLILFRDGNWSDAQIIARMSALLPALAQLGPSIVVVEHDRVRRRRLPIRSSSGEA
jgi:predicted nuclease of predicted toxin-antitoxin system